MFHFFSSWWPYEVSTPGLQIRVCIWKLFFLFLNPNICCGYLKEPSQWDGSFEHPKHMFKLKGEEINTIFGAQMILIWTYGTLISLVSGHMFDHSAHIVLNEHNFSNKLRFENDVIDHNNTALDGLFTFYHHCFDEPKHCFGGSKMLFFYIKIMCVRNHCLLSVVYLGLNCVITTYSVWST